MKGFILTDEKGKIIFQKGTVIPLIFKDSENLTDTEILDAVNPHYSKAFSFAYENVLQGVNTVNSIRLHNQNYYLKVRPLEDGDSKNIMFLIEKDNEWKSSTDENKTNVRGKRSYLFTRSQNEEIQKLFRKLTDFKYALDKSAIVSITDNKGIITYVNDKFCEISKYSRNELMGQNHNIINSGHHSSKFFKDMWKTIGTGFVWEGDIKNKAKDKSFYWMKSTIVPLMNEKNKPVYYLSIRVDITQTKLYEEKIKKINKKLKKNHKLLEKRQDDLLSLTEQLKETGVVLKKMNDEKDKFFSIIAHDLRNPFHALLGTFDLMANEFETLSVEEQKQMLNTVNLSTRNAYKLVENLLNWARLQSEGVAINKREFKLKEIVAESLSLIRESAKKKNILIVNDAKIDCSVYADPIMINSVLQNLLTNAIKFTPNNGKIVISAGKNISYAEISIQDSGIGISDEDLNKVFRIDVNHTTKGTNNEQGTGLGLILCKELIEKNDGTISVSSKKGKGTKFTFTLPIYK